MYHLERVGERAEAYVRSGDYANVAWHIERGGETLSEGLTGLADPIAGTPLPDEPIYRIFSMTKPLVSAVGVMLIDEGRLRLSDPVSAYLPMFADMQVMEADGTLRSARSTMLVEHLFTHRSGVTYQWQDNAVARLYPGRVRFADTFTLEELVKSLAELPLAADPGTMWHYSFSTDILAHLIAVVEGHPIDAVLRERLFAPLGMVDTGFFVPETQRHRILPMFGDANLTPGVAQPQTTGPHTLSYGAPYMIYPADDRSYVRGGVGLFSTMRDFRRATRFLISGRDPAGARMISRAGVRVLWANRLPSAQLPIRIAAMTKYQGYGYGLGGRVLVHPSQSPFYGVEGECGWEGAGTTYFWLDPRNDVTGIVMTQYIGQKFPLGEDIKAAFYQAQE